MAMSAAKYVVMDRVLFGRASWWQKLLAFIIGILVTYGAVMIFGVMILANPWAFLLCVGVPAIVAFYYEIELFFLAGLVAGAAVFIVHILLAFYNFLTMPLPIIH
jgi:hypothetical protein